MESSLFFNKVASFKLIRLHTEGLYFYIHSSMTISPFLILRKSWFWEASIAVQLWVLLLLLFLQALAKICQTLIQGINIIMLVNILPWLGPTVICQSICLLIQTPVRIFTVILGLILKTLFMYAKHTLKKPPHWIKGIFMCFLQTRAATLEFRAKFYSIVQAFLKHCFRTLKLFRIRITLIPSFLFMSKTNTGTCICTTHTFHRSSLQLVLVLVPKPLLHNCS